MITVSFYNAPSVAGPHTVWAEVFNGKPVASGDLPERIMQLVARGIPFSTASNEVLDIISDLIYEGDISGEIVELKNLPADPDKDVEYYVFDEKGYLVSQDTVFSGGDR